MVLTIMGPIGWGRFVVVGLNRDGRREVVLVVMGLRAEGWRQQCGWFCWSVWDLEQREGDGCVDGGVDIYGAEAWGGRWQSGWWHN